VTRTDKFGWGFAGDGNQAFLKANALVSPQNRFTTIALTDHRWHMGNLIAFGFSLPNGAAQLLKGFQEKSGNEMGLKFAGLGAFHLLADLLHLGRIH
jgi:hypothetical protein